jgi:hypothetical protein
LAVTMSRDTGGTLFHLVQPASIFNTQKAGLPVFSRRNLFAREILLTTLRMVYVSHRSCRKL